MPDADTRIERYRPAVEELCDTAFGAGTVTVTALRDRNGGRGAFSEVIQADLVWAGDDPAEAVGDRPTSVVAKLPVDGPNGTAARASGAYAREALAYRELLDHSPVGHPRAWAVIETADADGPACRLLLQDLDDHRFADQLDGLEPDDAIAVAESLGRFHAAWAASDRLADLDVRRNTVGGLPPTALEDGLRCLTERWGDVLDEAGRSTFADLVDNRAALVERFGRAPATLCHGDPRADNLAFDPEHGEPVLFDWQQMAVQLGEADLAWLAATSLTVPARRAVERDLVDAGHCDLDGYRLGLALPGLAVLLLAQRELPNERSRRFVEVSLQRIAAALADNETARLATEPPGGLREGSPRG
jgi:hypothetical protein